MIAASGRCVAVVDGGLLSTVQDLGRHGYGAAGVSPAGAADWFSARAANRLVGNPDGGALIETTLTGIAFDSAARVRIAVTGADASLTIGGMAHRAWTSHDIRPGDRVIVGPARRGVRSYVAFDGGIEVVATMNSSSTDVGAGFGGEVLVAGAVVTLGPNAPDAAERPHLRYSDRALEGFWAADALRAMPGPLAGRIATELMNEVCSRTYRASSHSSRQALRLDGAPIAMPPTAEAISSGTSAGCIQITGDGMPVVLLAEHQTTGGYVVPLCVVYADLPRAAQCAAGDEVAFRLATYAEARSALEAAAARLRSFGPIEMTADGGRDARLAQGFCEGAGPAWASISE